MTSEKDFLAFVDFIKNQDVVFDWVTVAISDDMQKDYYKQPEDRATISYLAPIDPKIIEQILSDQGWNVDSDFGNPFFEEREKGEIKLQTNNELFRLDGVIVEPFTIRRYFDGLYPRKTEIIHEFILYHNLYYDAENNRYLEPTTQETIIEYVSNNEIKVKTYQLRDYLAAKKMVLVRCHDHRRHGQSSVVDVIGEEWRKYEHKKDLYNYSVVITEFDHNKIASSRLLGKDILMPLEKPQHRDYSYFKLEDKKYEEFIVEIDEKSGKEITESCKQDGGMPFLQLVFFDKKVLQKYLNDSRIYTVGSRHISHLGIWGLPYGENKAGLIHVHLGDLQYIPHNEQRYWKTFNVPPKGGMSESSFRADYMAEFVDSEDNIHSLLKLHEEINKKFEEKYQFQLFKDLIAEDQHIPKTIHTLTSNDQGEFDQQILHMVKLCVDSLNIKELKKSVSLRLVEGEEDQLLQYLFHFLKEKLSLDDNTAKQILEGFIMIQEIRSKSSAHRKSKKNFPKLLKKYGLENLLNKEKFDKIAGIMVLKLSKILNSI